MAWRERRTNQLAAYHSRGACLRKQGGNPKRGRLDPRFRGGDPAEHVLPVASPITKSSGQVPAKATCAGKAVIHGTVIPAKAGIHLRFPLPIFTLQLPRTFVDTVLVLLLLTPALALGAQTRKPPSASQAADVPALLETAQQALNRNDFAEAVKALEAVVKAQPDVAAAWFNLGYAYTGLHQDAEAIKAYQKTLELAPDLFEGRLNLGILFLEQKQSQTALEHLRKATTLKPEHARAHLYYGRALAQSGQAEGAAKQFQEAIRLDPRMAIAQFDLGQLELQQKRPAEARAAFQKALALDPKLPQAELGSALAAEGLKDTAQAVAHFEKYLAMKPDDLETRFHLARLYLQQNQTRAGARQPGDRLSRQTGPAWPHGGVG